MLSGCDDYDDRYVQEYASVVRIDNFGEQKVTVWSTDPQETYEIKVLRSGHNISQATNVTVRPMTNDEWTSYANTYGLQRYYRLPDNCFSMGDANNQGVTLNFDGAQIASEAALTLMSDNIGTYTATLPPPAHEGEEWANVICLPITLESAESSVYKAQNVSLLLIDYKQPTLELSTTGFTKVACTSSHDAYVQDYTLTLPGENKWGFTVKVKNDKNLLDSYNQENETQYTLMQPGALEINTGEVWEPWTDQTFEFPVGTNSVSFKTRVTPSKVGMVDAFALNVTDPSIAIKLDPKNTSSIFAIAVKPSNIRLKPTATHSDYDGSHPASNLVDGKITTYFQSQTTAHDGDPVYGSYVDFKMPKSIQYFSIDFLSRTTGFKSESVPDEVNIYVSTDGANWTLCSKIKNMQKEVTKGNMTVNYGNYDAGQPINYIRWAVVMGGANGALDFRAKNTTANWSATSINIYGK